MKLSLMVDRFIKSVCAGKTNETPSAYRSKLNHLINFMGDIDRLSQEDLECFREFLLTRKSKRRGGSYVKGQLSKFTIRSILSTTRHFLKWAGNHGFIEKIEIANIKEPNPEPKPVISITVEKLLESSEKIIDDWFRTRNTALIYILRDTGCRVGAISKLRLDAMDLDKGYATAPDKNSQLAWLWFNPPTIAALRDWLKFRPLKDPKDDYIFTGARGFGLSTQGIRRVLTRLARDAGLTGRYNPHAFRHAFARDAILAGADLGQVSDMLGHHGIVVTHKYYARWAKIELKEFHRKFSPGRSLPFPEGEGSAKP